MPPLPSRWLSEDLVRARKAKPGSGGTSPIEGMFVSGATITGSAFNDYVFASTYTDGSNAETVNGGAGNDVILGDIGAFIDVTGIPNNFFDSAYDLDSISAAWSNEDNPLFGNASTPHISVHVETTTGTNEYFKLVLLAGQTITIDLDYGNGNIGGDSTISRVELYQDTTTLVAENLGEGDIGAGGYGSVMSSDAYMTYTAATSGVYYIRTRPGYGGGYQFNEDFILNISVTGRFFSGLPAAHGNDLLDGGDGTDQIFGVGGNDTILGSGGDDMLVGGAGGDYMDGGTGNDAFSFGIPPGIAETDTVVGGDGSDTLDFTRSNQGITVTYNSGPQVQQGARIIAFSGVEAIQGSAHADHFAPTELLSLYGNGGADTLDFTGMTGLLPGVRVWSLFRGGYYGNDVNFASAPLVEIRGFSNLIAPAGGNDVIEGSVFDDVLHGGDGDDLLMDLAGNDTLYGGAGNDTLTSSAYGAEVLDGGDGIDWVSYRIPGWSGTYGVRADLMVPGSNTNGATGDSYTSIENLEGTDKRDVLRGDNGANMLSGREDSDVLTGRGGADTLVGGSGFEKLTGGGGADHFRLGTDLIISDVDTIVDFQSGFDKIELVGSALGLPPGMLAASAFHVGNSAADALDRLIYRAGSGKLFFDPDGNGASEHVLIAVFENLPAIAVSDFIVT